LELARLRERQSRITEEVGGGRMVESSLVCGLVKRSSTVCEELTREVELGERRGRN
jgi:hypothetical protein